jgi:hypothetical protein
MNGYLENILTGGQQNELVTVGLSVDNNTLMRLTAVGIGLILFNHFINSN